MKTEYYSATSIPYGKMRFNLGLHGEYLIFKHLTNLEGTKKFLFNCYVPKKDGTTSEIDVILLHSSGIYVFESKNYSGWIFGSESQKQWTQTFRNGHKVRFFNPLMQNNGHIKTLRRILPDFEEREFTSIIAFSDRCQLKNINLETDNHIVVYRSDVFNVVSGLSYQVKLSDIEINNIYQRLHPFTQVTSEVRMAHINAVKKSGDRATAPIFPTTTSIYYSGQIEAKKRCAKCGSEMSLKTAKRGERKGQRFYGCSAFPKCRHTISLN